ncbi:MAG: hypothetical protein ACP5RT_01705 [Candidatus Micrarchaeia archaeon]
MLNIYYFNFLAELFPIIIGVVTLFVLKALNFRTVKIRLNEVTEFGKEKCDKKYDIFTLLARDRLIINGIFINSDSGVEKKALERLHLVHSWNIGVLMKSKKANHKLIIFAHGNEIINNLCIFSPISGLLLSYILSNSLELIYYE